MATAVCVGTNRLDDAQDGGQVRAVAEGWVCSLGLGPHAMKIAPARGDN